MADYGMIRIIAGSWRRRRLPVVEIDGLRPTPDRVRETLFNWLADDVPGARCLDLFAGTGALGLEAASRGAQWVTLVERDPRAVAQLEANCKMLNASQVEVVHRDAMQWIAATRERYEIVFLDPPFGSFDLREIAAALERHGRLLPNALIYLETRADHEAEAQVPESWRVLKDGRAGRVRYYLACADVRTP